MLSQEPIKSRVAILRERVAEADKKRGPTFDVPFRGRRQPCKRITISADLPFYRIQSGRTRRAQAAYLDKNQQLPNDFFADPEDPEVQNAQHEILLGMIREQDLDKDLEEKGQHTPLVLTFDGYVVDGNRRLAALRDRKEEYVEAVVLPKDAESREIYETELELQMQRETKAPYTWIDRALHIEYGINDLGEPPERVAARMRMDKEEVTKELKKLNMARLYLSWLGEQGKYHKIPSPAGGLSEQSFEEMVLRFESPSLKRKNEQEKRAVRQLCFRSIKGEAGYQEIRNIIKQFSRNADKIVERLRETRQQPRQKQTDTLAEQPMNLTTNEKGQDPLRALARITLPQPSAEVKELIEVISDDEGAKKVIEIVEDLEAEDKESRRQVLPLQKVQHALSDLRQVELSKGLEDVDVIAKLLDQLSGEVERLSRAIESLRSKQ